MTKVDPIEVELTFLLNNAEKLANQLNSMAKFEGESVQKDTYYIPSHRNFLDADFIREWLRVRETDETSSFTYKNWHKKKGVSCDEYETEVADAKMLKRILNQLDFKEIIVVNKKRRIWIYKDTEIAVDIVDELGDFIEVEAKKDFDSIEDAEKYLHKVLKELDADLGDQDFKGYPHRMLEKKGLL